MNAWNSLAKMGVLGMVGIVSGGVLAFVAVYGYIERPDHDLTKQAVAALSVGVGAMMTALPRFFGNGGGGPPA